MMEVGFEPQTSRFGVQCSTTKPSRSPSCFENNCFGLMCYASKFRAALRIMLRVDKAFKQYSGHCLNEPCENSY